MRYAIPFVALLAIASGCTSPSWTREVVDAGPGDVGRFASMHYHAEGGQKELRIVCESSANDSIVVVNRSGSGASWNNFVTNVIDSGAARVPATAERPDGTLVVAYMQGGEPGGATGQLQLASESAAGWSTELVRGGVRLAEPPAVAHELRPGFAPLIHVVYSIYPSRELWHSFRAEDEATWKSMRVGASIAKPKNSDTVGRHPLVVMSDSPPTMSLVYTKDGGVDHSTQCLSFFSLLDAWSTTEFQTGWEANVLTLTWGDERRFALGVVDSPALPSHGLVGLVRAGCDGGILSYREAYGVPPATWKPAVTPTIPTDTSRAFCYPSFAHDGLGVFYVSYYDADAGNLGVYKNHPSNPAAWQIETADGSSGDVGLYTSMVYDSVGTAILVAYYDATNGELKLARRLAN